MLRSSKFILVGITPSSSLHHNQKRNPGWQAELWRAVAARTEGFIWEVFQECFVTEFLGSAGHSSSSCLMMALDSDKTPHTHFLRLEWNDDHMHYKDVLTKCLMCFTTHLRWDQLLATLLICNSMHSDGTCSYLIPHNIISVCSNYFFMTPAVINSSENLVNFDVFESLKWIILQTAAG